MKYFFATSFIAALTLLAAVSFTQDEETVMPRMAITHDGNEHDKDDIGAVAMTEAIIWKGGGQLVHVSHSNHIGSNNPGQHANMILSAESGIGLFGIRPSVVHDVWSNKLEATVNLAEQIERSTATDPLFILQAGPWESMALAYDITDPTTHQFTTIITHSTWNNAHQHFGSHRKMSEFFNQYDPGGKWAAFTPPTLDFIPDQNPPAFNSGIGQWGWLSLSVETQFVLDRTIASAPKQGDMSDAGMAFYFFTGITNPSMQDIRNFFGL